MGGGESKGEFNSLDPADLANLMEQAPRYMYVVEAIRNFSQFLTSFIFYVKLTRPEHKHFLV